MVNLNANVLFRYHERHELGYGACDRLTGNDRFELAYLPGHILDAAAILDSAACC